MTSGPPASTLAPSAATESPEASEASDASSSDVLVEPELRRQRRARGLTLWAIVAVVVSPFSLPSFGAGFLLGAGLVVVSVLLERRGVRARGPLIAGIVAMVSSLAFAGACGFLFLRTAEVTGREEAHQDRVERRFDRAFDAAGDAPLRTDAGHRDGEDDGVPEVGADFPDAVSQGRRRKSE
jgi:hypothetical protein